MKRVFTDFVRALAAGEEPSEELLDAVLEKLHDALIWTLRRQNLFYAPPRYLGVYAESWEEDEALQELVADAFLYNFDARLRRLTAHLPMKDNIEGLVFRNLKHFVWDRQKQVDPLGHRSYELLRHAVDKACMQGRLHKLKEEERTRYASSPGVDEPLAEFIVLKDFVDAQADLFPRLFRGGKFEALAEDLAKRLPPACAVFDFFDLLSIWKDRYRAWARRLGLHEHDTGYGDDDALEPLTPPPQLDFVQREDYRRLRRCVEKQIRQASRGRARSRDAADLDDLWRTILSALAEEEKIPSQRGLAKTLEFHRGRVKDLIERLREMIRICRITLTEAPA